MNLRMLPALALLLSILAGYPPAFAEERISLFHSDIVIAEDGSMVVEETIQVNAEGDRIQRGIYRDFPTRYKDRFGNTVKVDFEVLGVSRDGGEEKWHTEKQSNGVRIYAGDAATLIEPGVHTYHLRYHTNRQLGFFEGAFPNRSGSFRP